MPNPLSVTDQLKPTGEWTVEEVTTPHHGKWNGLRFITDSNGRHLGSMNEHEAKAVVEAHKAALDAAIAAEREKWIEVNRQHEDAWSKELIDTCDKARAAQQPLVDLLEWCEREHQSEHDGLGNMIRVALAKVKEGKV